MLLFCPTCGNVLIVEEGQKCYRFACNTCPYVHNITRKVNNRKYPKLKEVDDVLGGAKAWETLTPHQKNVRSVNTPVPTSCKSRPDQLMNQ
uniref:DNA-directed RNA polymerases III 12.5 kDa polypeptide n=1 Tax=Osmerus mordax TaxID=8014 RepID=C1BL61_OSMMO|nr:DNA-directed RNA polymerases III 12.5 kDa polypeptide [Osmerus mordax]